MPYAEDDGGYQECNLQKEDDGYQTRDCPRLPKQELLDVVDEIMDGCEKLGRQEWGGGYQKREWQEGGDRNRA